MIAGSGATDRRAPVALVGPTASGKSTVALSLAEHIDAEVVAVDAFTVYRGMDIGTAKPAAEQRARVPHHMLDVLDPTQDCTVQWFQAEARTAIERVRARGKTPLLVGGSGLYFRAVIDPLEFPPTDAGVRSQLTDRYAGDPQAAHAALAAADPEAADKIDAGNLRRTVRALEVLALTGRPFSAFATAWQRYQSMYEGLRVVGLEVPRGLLEERIEARVDAMVAAGLVGECRKLAALELSATARQAIGYAEVFAHLAGAVSLDEAITRTKLRTRRYAARQQRWFARDPRVQWLPPDAVVTALAA